MRRSSVFALACALAFAGAWAYTPVRHDGSYTTNGVTYAQRGGLGSADYVVTNIDANAVGKVKSVNGKTGDVSLDASDVGAATVAYVDAAVANATPADYATISNAAMNALSRAEAEAGLTEWEYSGIPQGYTIYEPLNYSVGEWEFTLATPTGTLIFFHSAEDENATSIDMTSSGVSITATRTRLPTMASKWALSNVTNASGNAVGASDVGAMAADARIDRLYNGGGSRYISGDGSVYSQNAEERWHVEFNGDTYDFTPHFGFAPNYWECSDFVGGQMASLYYDASEENWVLDIGPELWAEGTASDSYLDFQLGTAHFICTRYSTGTTFSYETRLAYTNDIPDISGATNALAQTIPNNITRTGTDATLVHCDSGTCTNAILYIRQATHSLAGLMTAADKTALDALAATAVTREAVTNVVNEVKELHYDEVMNVTWETRIVGGEMKFFAVTNANISVLGN